MDKFMRVCQVLQPHFPQGIRVLVTEDDIRKLSDKDIIGTDMSDSLAARVFQSIDFMLDYETDTRSARQGVAAFEDGGQGCLKKSVINRGKKATDKKTRKSSRRSRRDEDFEDNEPEDDESEDEEDLYACKSIDTFWWKRVRLTMIRQGLCGW